MKLSSHNFVFPSTLFILSSIVLLSNLVINNVICQQELADNEVNTSPATQLLIIAAVDSKARSERLVRLNNSAEAFDLPISFIHLDDESANLTFEERIFQKLRFAAERHKNERNSVILVIRSLDLLINGDKSDILNGFKAMGDAKILFSADSFCVSQPKKKCQNSFDKSNDKHVLNSRSFIGYASSIVELLEIIARQHQEGKQIAPFSFQNQATYIYLNDTLREKLGLKLDIRSELFQSLNSKHSSADDEIELDSNKPERFGVINLAHKTRPVIVHASGLGRIALNSLGNYLGKAWTSAAGCRHCNSSKISLKNIKDDDLPRVLIGVFIEEATPFMKQFYETLKLLDYPPKQVHLFIHNTVDYHTKGLREFLEQEGHRYASYELSNSTGNETSISQINPPKQKNATKDLITDGTPKRHKTEWQARNYALQKCKQLSCDYYLSLDSTARLDRPETLRELIETNKTIVAPMLTRPRKLWSNFWGSITDEGFYSRSQDYVDLVTRERIGVWNVPLVMDCYLIEGRSLRQWFERQQQQSGSPLKLDYFDENFPQIKPALIFSRNLRQSIGLDNAMGQADRAVMQYVTNEQEFGHLVDTSHFNLSRKHPEFYELESNMLDWQQVYMHDKYFDLLDEYDEEENHPKRVRLESPCQDVYWFPLVSDEFCTQLIEIMENFGQWSAGKNDDPRIEGGYESVPTRDIHFRQVGLHQMWLLFLRQFVMPIQMKEYIGYEHDPPRTDLAFVVRYNPQEQNSLRPHHDSSTYTLNIALNAPGQDYEGGGCRFVRYNCSVTESRRGWALIHPGRLTHYHEGLPVTKGTRYIMVTFIDP